MPERHANGKYTSENARWKNAFLTDSRESHASARWTNDFGFGRAASGAASGLLGTGAAVDEDSGADVTRKMARFGKVASYGRRQA